MMNVINQIQSIRIKFPKVSKQAFEVNDTVKMKEGKIEESGKRKEFH